ncbi:hypothetical protein G9Q86_08430 [Pseudomonas sp. CCUG 57209]|uniref:hypothetical protein n=1 Tax=Pseudomonas sivasensis TaxID=1880678 RepID=UPI0015EBB986|nr:hypothetical protein [Pseudomonas sivasensis]MBA2928597.1 hypothetical protein [Pseudomonas sivasensis]
MSEIDLSPKLINLESIETDDIRDILASYFIDGEIDNDGDLYIDSPARMYIKADKEFGILRFFSFVRLKDDWNETDLSIRLDSINRASFSVKYSTMKSSVMVEYGIPLFGYIDNKHLVKVVHHIEGEIELLKLRINEHIEG